MAMIKAWSQAAWEDYLWWQAQDKRSLKRINQLIRDIERNPFEGLGKPEPLRGNFSGMWSRRIDAGNRLIYSVEGNMLMIHSAKDHYTDK